MEMKDYAHRAGMLAPGRIPNTQVRQSESRQAMLKAELAVRGIELKQIDGGRFSVVRWGLSRTLNSLDAVAAFAQQMGVPHG